MARVANRPGRGSAGDVLPDLLKPGVVTVFCGSAAGKCSAKQGKYYAKKSNRFWGILAEICLTPRKFDPSEYTKLAKLRIGLTDLNKIESGSDRELSPGHYNVNALCRKIKKYCPRILVFNGKGLAEVFLKERFGVKVVDYGLQSKYRLGDTKVFVLPSTSGRLPRKYRKVALWRELAGLHYKILAE